MSATILLPIEQGAHQMVDSHVEETDPNFGQGNTSLAYDSGEQVGQIFDGISTSVIEGISSDFSTAQTADQNAGNHTISAGQNEDESSEKSETVVEAKDTAGSPNPSAIEGNTRA